MLKKFLLCLLIVIFVGIGTPALAYEDYSKTEGDFSIFSLNDDIDSVKDKINYLVAKKIILATSSVNSESANFLIKTDKQEINCIISFDKNIVNKIQLLFQNDIFKTESKYNTLFKKTIEKKKDELSQQHGEPIVTKSIPKYKDIFNLISRSEFSTTYSVYEWLANNTRILLGIDWLNQLSIVFTTEESYQDWVRYKQINPRYRYITESISHSSFFFDTQTIKRTYNKEIKDQVIDVWIYNYYTTKGKNDYIAEVSKLNSTNDYSKFDHSITHWQIYQNKIRFTSNTDYDIEGSVISDDKCSGEWTDIIPESVGESIADAIKNYMKPKKKK